MIEEVYMYNNIHSELNGVQTKGCAPCVCPGYEYQ